MYDESMVAARSSRTAAACITAARQGDRENPVIRAETPVPGKVHSPRFPDMHSLLVARQWLPWVAPLRWAGGQEQNDTIGGNPTNK